MTAQRRKTPTALLAAAKLLVLGVSVLFLTAGLQKFSDLPHFRGILAEHAVLPPALQVLAIWLVPLVGAVVGAAGSWGVLRGARVAGASSASLAPVFAAFTGYSAVLLASPPPAPVSCGCVFGGPPLEDWSGLMVRNGAAAVVLPAVSSVLLRAPSPSESRPRVLFDRS